MTRREARQRPKGTDRRTPPRRFYS